MKQTRRFRLVVSVAFNSTALALASALALAACYRASAATVYETTFDGFSPGPTQPAPGASGQGGWYRVLAEGSALGEIQAAVANGGLALHQSAPGSVSPGTQTIDRHGLTPPDLAALPVVTLSFDFRAHSSSLAAANTFIAALTVEGGPHPGFELLGVGVSAGNGTPKSVTGVNIGLTCFNGVNDNEGVLLTVGQDLAWDVWHHVEVAINQGRDEYLYLMVDGTLQSLTGRRLPRSNDGGVWKRGQLMETLTAMIIPDDATGARTDDDVYWDNIRLTAAPAGANWPMRQRDAANTGRADFSVPASRLNASFFSLIRWQKPSPDSPNDGNFSSSSMVFYDSAGPGEADLVVAGYHWPKGVQGMDRHTGAGLWHGNPDGGESIGQSTPAFSTNGKTIYVINDATTHPMMAFAATNGPSVYRHNGADANPGLLEAYSPKIAPDGRIFVTPWLNRPRAGADNGASISLSWSAASDVCACNGSPALWPGASGLMVVSAGRCGTVKAWNGSSGDQLWSVDIPAETDADATIDPANGNIYLPIGTDSIWVVGLNKDGNPLWTGAALQVFTWQDGVNNRQRAQSAGCLAADGLTYFFQTVSEQGDGRLYAIRTADGSVKWSVNTASRGWEQTSSSPIVTSNGVVIVGNNDGGDYYAILDAQTNGLVLATLPVASGGTAKCSATLSPDGLLYLPARLDWTRGNGDQDAPTYEPANVFTAFDLNENPSQPLTIGTLYVDLRATNASAGSVTWTNQGALGNFTRHGAASLVSDVAGTGIPGVYFDGDACYYEGPASVPDLEGGSDRSVEVWVFNPAMTEEESLVAWGRRDWAEGANFSLNCGTSLDYGAVTHWGWDLGWGEAARVPASNSWHHFVYTYNGGVLCKFYVDGQAALRRELPAALVTHSGNTILLGAQHANDTDLTLFFSGYINTVRVHGGVMTSNVVTAQYALGPARVPAPGTNLVLTIASTHGSPVPSVGPHEYTNGQTVACSMPVTTVVVDDTEYACTGWTGTGSVGSGLANSVTFAITNDTTLTWGWTASRYHLTVLPQGSGHTDVSSCWFAAGTVQMVTAFAVANWQFAGWAGDTNGCLIQSNTITVAMNQPRQIIPCFVPATSSNDAAHFVWSGGAHVAPFSSWPTAATNVQAAIDAAGAGEVILVTNGLYRSAQEIRLTNGVSLKSANGDNQTLLVGAGTNRCLWIGHSNALVQGFTLTNGCAVGGNGGGVYVQEGTLSSCVVISNRATVYSAAPAPAVGGYGGGIYLEHGLVENCVVMLNNGHSGVEVERGLVDRCTVQQNYGWTVGGVALRASGALRNSVIAENSADMINPHAFTEHAAGVLLDFSSGAVMESCTVVSNHMRHTILCYDIPGVGNYGGVIRNSIVVSNDCGAGQLLTWGGTSLSVCSSDPISGPGCFQADPRFINLAGGDYRLHSDSPCINIGTNLAWMLGALDLAGQSRLRDSWVDLGAYEFDPGQVIVQWTAPVDDHWQGPVQLAWETVTANPQAATVDLSANRSGASHSISSGLPLTGSLTWATTNVPDSTYELRATVRGTNGQVLAETTRWVWINNSVVLHEGAITADATWSAAQVHVVVGSLTLQSNRTLTVAAGAIIKFLPGTGVLLQSGARLRDDATPASPVIFTALADDSAGGDTNGDGDQSRARPGDWLGFTVEGTAQLELSADVQTRYLSFTHAGTLAANETWTGASLHWINSTLTIPSGRTLTVHPGTLVKFQANQGLTVEPGGVLLCQGTLSLPVVFTSSRDGGESSTNGAWPGDWTTLLVNGRAELQHAILRYGGGGGGEFQAMVKSAAATSDLLMRDCLLTDALLDAVSTWGGTNRFENCMFADSDRAVLVRENSGVTMANCTFHGHRWGLVPHGGVLRVWNSLVTGSSEFGIFGEPTEFHHNDVWNPGAANYSGSDRTGIQGNISSDPKYRDAEGRSFQLAFLSPAIDAADTQHAPMTDHAGAPRYDDPRVANTGIAGDNNAFADMGAFEFVEAATSDLDLVASQVSGPSEAVAGDTVTLTWQVRNQGAGVCDQSWHDQIFLVPDVSDGWSGETLCAEVASSATLDPEGIARFTAAVRVPGGTEGVWRWKVKANARGEVFEGQNWTNNLSAASAPMQLRVRAVPAGGRVQGYYSALDGAAWFKIEQPSGQDLLVAIDSAALAGQVRIYAGFGRMPNEQQYDLRSEQWNTPRASLSLPGSSQARTVFLCLAAAPGLYGSPFGMSVTALGFGITGVSPAVVGSVGFVTLEVRGSGYRTGDVFEAISPLGIVVQAVETNLVSSTLAYATFDLAGASPGMWDVRARRAGLSATATRALAVVQGGGPNLAVEVVGRNVVRAGRKAQFTLAYANSGNADSWGALLMVGGVPNDAEIELGPEFVPPSLAEGLTWSGPLYTRSDAGTVFVPLVLPRLRPGESGTAGFSLKVPGAQTFQITPYVLGPMVMNSLLYEWQHRYQAVPALRDGGGRVPKDGNPADQEALEELLGVSKSSWSKGTFVRWFWNGACVGEAEFMLNSYVEAAKAPGSSLAGWGFQRVTKNGFLIGHTTVMAISPTGDAYVVDNYVSPTVIPLQGAGTDKWIIPSGGGAFGLLDGLIMSTGNMESTPYWQVYDPATPPICPVPLAEPGEQVTSTNSADPNVKLGPAGAGDGRFISSDEPLYYFIEFENMPTAGAAAQEVLVTDALDPNLDWSSFVLDQIGFNGVTLDVPPGLQSYQTTAYVTSDPNPIQVRASLDANTGVVTWHLMSIDPATGDLVEDPLAGFLPPNDATQRGEGYVSFLILPKPNLPTDTVIRNQATIVFDVNPPIATGTVTNTIDAASPISSVLALPSWVSPEFTVSWTGSDEGRSGIACYDIYAAEDGGPAELWLAAVRGTNAAFTGEVGHTYSFFSVAMDRAGNGEALPAHADLTVSITTNTAPILDPVDDCLVRVNASLFITNRTFDANGDRLWFSLVSAPAGAAITSDTGILRWTPSCAQGSTTNLFIVRVTDNGTPPMSASQSFHVIVPECIEAGLGNTIMQVGTTSSVPVRLLSTVALTNLTFQVLYPAERFTNFLLTPNSPHVLTQQLRLLSPGCLEVSFTLPGSSVLHGPANAADLAFVAPTNQTSAFVPLLIENVDGRRPDGGLAANASGQAGRVVVIGREPLLEGVHGLDGKPHVLLYGNPGVSYQLERRTNIISGSWQPLGAMLMTNLWRDAHTGEVSHPAMFFRAH